MKTIKQISAAFVLLACGVATAATDPYPLEYFATREAMSNVAVSPNGEKLSMLKILSKTGNPMLHIYDADDLAGKPYIVGAEKMEITSYYWASDQHIVMTFRQQVRDKIEGQNQGVYETRIAILDVVEEEFDDFDVPSPAVVNLLPNDPYKVIISMQPGAEEDLSIREAFRPRAYYTLDLNKGTKNLLIRGKIDLGQIEFDMNGNPRIGRGYDTQTESYLFFYRDPGEKKWREIYRVTNDDWGLFTGEDVLAPDDAVPGNVLALAHNGHDKIGLWTYNTNTLEFDELLYRRNDADVLGIRYHSNTWTNADTVTAVIYGKDNYHAVYFDDVEEATLNQLAALVPDAYYPRITSRSRDGNSLILMNIGPKDPGSYYMFRQGELKFVGSQQPLLEPEQLANVKYITYEARDGRKIPAYVTIPNSEPPYPLIVLPHGGPHVQETVMFDEWGQMLANNGYMVIQPQYRMSLGYGKDHFLSAFINGSEGGRKMQDDKDDGALYLIEKGLVDKDRVAMFGWSYGGYAALVAASRTPQIYQCVIAGAAVADPRRQANEYGNATSGVGKIWQEVYQYGAVQPVEEVDKVNVPILLIHGSVDQRVRPRQAKIYRKALDKADKWYKYVELEGADHFYNTLFYRHQIELYESMIDFLKNDCGQGGL